MSLKPVFSIFCALLIPCGLLAQDERYFRELFVKEKIEKVEVKKTYKYTVPTPFYSLDVNGDGKNESFVYSKKESEDWLDIFDSEKNPIFSYKFDTFGVKSRLYKMRFSSIDENIGIALCYFYEGHVKYSETDSSGRVYLLTFHKKKFDNFKMLKGPYLFYEHKGLKRGYVRRIKDVEILDLNNDKRNEVLFKHNLYSEVYSITNDGTIQSYRN